MLKHPEEMKQDAAADVFARVCRNLDLPSTTGPAARFLALRMAREAFRKEHHVYALLTALLDADEALSEWIGDGCPKSFGASDNMDLYAERLMCAAEDAWDYYADEARGMEPA